MKEEQLVPIITLTKIINLTINFKPREEGISKGLKLWKLISENPLISGIIGTVVGSVIVFYFFT